MKKVFNKIKQYICNKLCNYKVNPYEQPKYTVYKHDIKIIRITQLVRPRDMQNDGIINGNIKHEILNKLITEFSNNVDMTDITKFEPTYNSTDKMFHIDAQVKFVIIK